MYRDDVAKPFTSCKGLCTLQTRRAHYNLKEISCSEEGEQPHLGIGALGSSSWDRGRGGDVRNQQGQGKAQDGKDPGW